MKIDDSNKEEVFYGLLRREFGVEDMRSINAQFAQDPSLARDFSFHKKMVEAAFQIETDGFRAKVQEYAQEQQFEEVHSQAQQDKNIFTKFWKQYPFAIAVAVSLLLLAGISYLYLNPQNEPLMAQQVEILYQEITPGSFGAAGATDTLDRSTVIINYPSVNNKAYSFQGDTLVLYGNFQLEHLRYRFNTQTQERTLFIDTVSHSLIFSTDKKEL